MERWTENFTSALDRPSNINDDAIDRFPQKECNVLLDTFPSVKETRKSVLQRSSGTAPGANAIPVMIYKARTGYGRADSPADNGHKMHHEMYILLMKLPVVLETHATHRPCNKGYNNIRRDVLVGMDKTNSW